MHTRHAERHFMRLEWYESQRESGPLVPVVVVERTLDPPVEVAHYGRQEFALVEGAACPPGRSERSGSQTPASRRPMTAWVEPMQVPSGR